VLCYLKKGGFVDLPRSKKKPTLVYVGHERIANLEKKAISVSYHVGEQVTPSKFVKLLIDRYAEMLENELIKEVM
jgi:predicted TPR repeat methyltransferase